MEAAVIWVHVFVMKIGNWVPVGLFDPSPTEDKGLRGFFSISPRLQEDICVTMNALAAAKLLNMKDLVAFHKQKSDDGEDFALD